MLPIPSPRMKDLPKDRELEESMKVVHAREYTERLDWVRHNLAESCNAHAFLTMLATKDPNLFMNLVDEAVGLSNEWKEIDAFIRSGQKIQAIKKHREITGLGLKESKHAVDDRATKLGF